MSCQTWKRFFRFQSLRRAPSTREVSRAQFCSAGEGGRNTTSAEKGGTVSGQTVVSARRGAVVTVAINRPEVRNAVNRETAARLLDELSAFDRDPQLSVAILHGNGGNFCAGYDLKELANHTASVKLEQDVTKGPGPMGPSRLQLSKPLIAAVSGYAVAGGLELALLADLRVLEESAIMGVFCRRFVCVRWACRCVCTGPAVHTRRETPLISILGDNRPRPGTISSADTRRTLLQPVWHKTRTTAISRSVAGGSERHI
ncbi:enoyl-CoA hydratase EchA19 isoform X2 [Osmerus mordax]|uniref:enoyl-CoA hydratase EchA19 isoform X2 n=1 Tax=Osmerus mordax TaxID=8014 RepID=UPI00350EB999